jgi:predicted transcriptional regulator
MSHRVHHLPVVEERRVLGMVSSADLMKLQFQLPPAGPPRIAFLARRGHAGRLMRSPAIAVTEHETVQRAAELMAVNGIHSLPVVNSNEELVGIVTTTDLMRCCLDPLPDTPAADRDETKLFPLDDERIAAVLAAARRAVNTGHDPCGISAALLTMQQRVDALQQVATAAKRYLNAGQDERLHTTLQKAIELADRFDERMRHAMVLGLGSA